MTEWLDELLPDRPRVAGRPDHDRELVAPPAWGERAPRVTFRPVRCPQCRRRKPRTYGRYGRVRYHLCLHCQIKFTSEEDEG